MEQLRLEYLAREERFMLDGDRNELRTIKQELDELRFVYEAHAPGSSSSHIPTREESPHRPNSREGVPRIDLDPT